MPALEFVGQTARAPGNAAANPSRLVNCYREPVVLGGRTRYMLKSVPGMQHVATIGQVFLRAMAEISGALYAVCGGKLFSISKTWHVAELGEVLDAEETTISGNNGLVTVSAGGKYYVWDGAALTEPTPGNFEDFGAVEFLGGYTILTERGGRQFCWSDLADAKTLDPLSFATAETNDDTLVRAFNIRGLLWLFKSGSAEIWYQASAPETTAAAFDKMPGGMLDVGLRSFGLIARFSDGAFFVGSDGIVYTTSGTSLLPISTPAVEAAVALLRPSRCFVYEDRGHKMLCIRMLDGPAWCYDLATGEWHERGEGWPHRRWDAVASARIEGGWLVGSDTGDLALLGRFNSDGAEPLYRTAVSLPLYQDGQAFTIAELEFFARQGVHDTMTEGEPAITVRVSKDGGQTYGLGRDIWLGATGRYDKRLILRALGQARQAVVEVTTSDPLEIPIYADCRVRLA